MKRFSVYALGLILVAGALLGIFLAVNNSRDDKTKSTSPSDLKTTQTSKKACSIFTLADAKRVLGARAKGGVDQDSDKSQDDLSVSTCTYTQDNGNNAPVSSNKTASLEMHVPVSPAGIESNASQFSQVKPADVQDVPGYGSGAYWDAKHGQLNILKNNTWYVLTFGPISTAGRSLEQTKQMADLLIDKM